MQLERLESLDPRGWTSAAVTIGNFDGVHRGHQALISAAVGRAQKGGGSAVVLTFDPHPARFLAPDRAPASLMTIPQRAEIIATLGVDRFVVLPFDDRMARKDAAQFAGEVLKGALSAKTVVVGEGFRFGRGREGSVDTLRGLSGALGFVVQAVPPVLQDGAPVSSSRVRQALAAGDVGQAAGLLGRRFFLDGEIVHGDGRGRTLGIPTANVAPADQALPALAVYACWARVDGGGPLRAVVNVGRRPTFGGGGEVVEAHLLDHDEELYGRRLRIEFERRLREEVRFPDVQALLRQIEVDIAKSRSVLEKP